MEVVALALVCLLAVWLENVLYRKNAFKGLSYRCYLSRSQVFEGEEIELIEEIENRKWLPLPWFKSEITVSRWLEFAGAQSQLTDRQRFVPSFFMLKSYQRVSRRWKVRCLKRGEYSVEQIVLVTTDLLGNLTLSQGAKAGATVLVLPRPLTEDELQVTPRSFTGDIVVRRSLLEDPFSTAGVREYTQREPMNRIHWAATAREQRLMIYNNDSTSRQNLTVILNMQSREFEQFRAIDEETMECAIRICAGLFESALNAGMPLCFVTNASTDDTRSTIFTNEFWGVEHIESLWQLLARLNLTSTEDFPIFLGDNYHAIQSTDIVLVTAYLSERVLEFVWRKQADGIRVKVILLGDVSDHTDVSACDLLQLMPQEVKKEAAL